MSCDLVSRKFGWMNKGESVWHRTVPTTKCLNLSFYSLIYSINMSYGWLLFYKAPVVKKWVRHQLCPPWAHNFLPLLYLPTLFRGSTKTVNASYSLSCWWLSQGLVNMKTESVGSASGMWCCCSWTTVRSKGQFFRSSFYFGLFRSIPTPTLLLAKTLVKLQHVVEPIYW